ncbi:MAG TPA: glucan biosynthesis protein G [Nevskiaceae bacterium]|nr:glucan biosynthesis protein G [Nevskiaceae bacterium]
MLIARACRTALPALLGLMAALLPVSAAQAFGFEDVARRAEALAAEDFQRPRASLPRDLAALGYDRYRDIRYKPEQSIWRGNKLQFELQLLHPGLYFDVPVALNIISATGVRPIAFDPDRFDYGANKLDPDGLKNLFYSGFRVHFPVNRPDYKDEVLVFQGASYFRALGKDQRYGLSARGLAVDTGMLSGEEFPYFREFWIEWPRAKDDHLVIHALLDSRRVTGAYQFTLRPGASTTLDVKSRLYLREPVAKLGLAPLTSMFFFGENQRPLVEDYRPEVHDSDGLMILTHDDEWIWRPLVNPRRLLITSFGGRDPKGFGLMQRDRRLSSYEDLEARYERRPSAWVVPRNDWGPGRVELVQIPTPDETNDNIVAYWVPDQPPPPGRPYDVNYTLSWQMNAEVQPPHSHVVQTRRGHGYLREPDDSIRLNLDFDGPALRALPADSKIFPAITVGDNGELLERQVYRNEATGGWRLSFRFRRQDPERPVELRAQLRHEQEAVSETWSYILPP